MEIPCRRILLLTEGQLGAFSAKTAVCLLRYRRNDMVGIVDSTVAGQPIEKIITGLHDVPIFADVAEAEEHEPDALLIGIAPVGGALPAPMRRQIIQALNKGMSIISGLHTPLRKDPEFAELAQKSGSLFYEVRQPDPIDRIAMGRARQYPVKRVITVGTSTNVGKMLTACELRKAAQQAGLDAAFVPTGQTGILVEGWGITIDHVLSDFTAGAAEMLVEHVADRQVCFIEGQGSLDHPGYSGVTLSLLHGTCPQALVLVHRPGRELHNDIPDCPIAPIEEQIALYERALSPMFPGKVVAVAVNTFDMSEEAANEAVQSIARRTNLPAADPIRHGCASLLGAIRDHLQI
jgi:uncharacterized NAD-dependent epimerase/dehydratase family protein